MRICVLTLLCLIVYGVRVNAKETFPLTLEESLLRLDHVLSQKDMYDEKKEMKIGFYRENLRRARNDVQRYEACYNLYNEYKSYQCDSAYAYADRSLHLALQLGNRDFQVEAECALTFCMFSAGLYKEAFDKVREIKIENVGKSAWEHYCLLQMLLNYAIADYNHAQPYNENYMETGNAWSDSLLSAVQPQSVSGWYATAQRQMKSFEYDASIASFKQLLALQDVDLHLKAIVYSCIGWMNRALGKEEESMRWLAWSAMCDVMASVKETTSLCGLAEMLYKHGDIERSIHYVQLSLAYANFYGARHRKIEVGNILPIIEQERYELVAKQRNLVVGGIAIVSLLAMFLLAAFFILYRQKKKLQETRNVIAENNRILQRTNSQLQEANKIKNEYIGNSFYFNSVFIDKVERLYKMIDHKIAAKQYSDLQSTLRNMTTMQEERDNIFTQFDETFLKIFPDFVEQFNSLFPENERKYPSKGKLLTTEMRIFALIRLGVTESDRIAQFLNKSIHTINTYKTRVKNRSEIENDVFEQRIMQIGTVC